MIIQVTDFGIPPDSGEDAVSAVQRAIQAAAEVEGPVTLEFAAGRYDFYPENAIKAPYYISNTASEQENADVTKIIGLLFKQIHNLTIEGNGSWFIFHGKQTMFVFDECENMVIRNVQTDFDRPTMAEMTIEAVAGTYIDVNVHPSSRYKITDGKLYWFGDGWQFHHGPMQEYDAVTNTTWRIENQCAAALRVEELAPSQLRLFYEDMPATAVGRVWQVRDGLRDQVGAFVTRCRNVTWHNVGIHYMHGLGIINQFSENLTFEKLDLTPRGDLGRTVTAFADFIHFSGCRGLIKVVNSRFIGGHDDPINVHGTHLRIVNKPNPKQLVVRFMHHQSYGFQAFFPGDDIHLVREESLTAYESNTIASAVLLHPREMLLTLVNEVQGEIHEHDIVENVTWNADVEISNNYFARIPTRGMLLSTRGKVIVQDNVLDHMTMSGILIADDGGSWFESGPVRDVTIRRNHFIECGGTEHPVIYIVPENTEIHADEPVHRNIRIEDNIIQSSSALPLFAKSTHGLDFLRNEIRTGNHMDSAHTPMIVLLGCAQVRIADNRFDEDSITRSILIEKMTPEHVLVAPDQGLQIIAKGSENDPCSC